MPYMLHPLWKTSLSSLSEDELWEHYETCLRAFDWYYSYSDDHGVYQAGTEQQAHVHALRTKLTEVDADRANALYEKHSPWTKG